MLSHEPVGWPNIAQLQMVARIARDTGRVYPFERDMLYVAAVLQGLVVVGERHQGLTHHEAKEAMRVRVRRALGALEESHPVMGWHLRLALGLGTEEDQESEAGQRYVALVASAWRRSDLTRAWRRHVAVLEAGIDAGAERGSEAGTERGCERGAEATVNGELAESVTETKPAGAEKAGEGVPASGAEPPVSGAVARVQRAAQAGSFASRHADRMQRARQQEGWAVLQRYGSCSLQDIRAQIRAEALAYVQANSLAARKR